MSDAPETIARRAYQAWVDRDRAALETLLADEFRFTSPRDHCIDRASYLARCWPRAQAITGFHIVSLIEAGDRVVATYEAQQSDGTPLRNTDVVTVRNGKLVEIEVYVGRETPPRAGEAVMVTEERSERGRSDPGEIHRLRQTICELMDETREWLLVVHHVAGQLGVSIAGSGARAAEATILDVLARTADSRIDNRLRRMARRTRRVLARLIATGKMRS